MLQSIIINELLILMLLFLLILTILYNYPLLVAIDIIQLSTIGYYPLYILYLLLLI